MMAADAPGGVLTDAMIRALVAITGSAQVLTAQVLTGQVLTGADNRSLGA